MKNRIVKDPKISQIMIYDLKDINVLVKVNEFLIKYPNASLIFVSEHKMIFKYKKVHKLSV